MADANPSPTIESSDADSLMIPPIRIVLSNTQHPGNIGSAARAMLTMGLSELVLVAPARYPDPQATAMASNAGSVLEQARVVSTLAEAVEDCGWVIGASARQRHLGDEPLSPEGAATALIETASGAKVALVFGCERTGLTNEELELCNTTTRVPTNPEYGSLNLANAVQLYAWEIRRACLADRRPTFSSKPEHPLYQPATHAEVENFYEHLERVLLGTGFLDPTNPGLLMRRLRTLFGRMRADRNEVAILRGILTSVERPKVRTRRPGASENSRRPLP